MSAGCILRRPDADGVFRNRIEGPDQLAGLGIERLDEAADAVFAAVGADQHLVLDHGRRHRFAIALFRIGDVALPGDRAGLGIERHQLRIERGEIDEIAEHFHAAIVRAAAIGGDWAHLVLVVPELLAVLASSA